MTGHASSRIWQGLEAFVADLLAAILANAVSALGDPVARVLGLLTLLLEDLLDGLGIRPLALNLGEVGLPESLAHGDLVSTSPSPKHGGEMSLDSTTPRVDDVEHSRMGMRELYSFGGVGMSLKRRFWFSLPLIALVAALVPSPAAATTTVTLVASGLDSPRGVAFVGSGAAVAEAGHGSDNPADCVGAGFEKVCFGNTSQISWVNTATGSHTPLVKGFFSLHAGFDTLGMSGLSTREGKLYGQIAVTSREVPPQFTIGKQAGHLISVNTHNKTWQSIASVGDFDFDYTDANFTQPNPMVCGACPGTQEHDANPNDVLATSQGWLVVDSGSNTVTRVGKNGTMNVLHHFPWRDPNFHNFPSDEVPTCVTSSNEALWIGTLAGHLFRLEEDEATQVTPRDSAGNALLSHVTGCTSGDNGTLYLVNMFGAGNPGNPSFFNGNVVKYDTESGKGSMLADALHNPALALPYMAKVGPDGNLWVTSGAICPVDGSNPFAGAPFPVPNFCTVGGKKGGRLLKLSLPKSEENE